MCGWGSYNFMLCRMGQSVEKHTTTKKNSIEAILHTLDLLVHFFLSKILRSLALFSLMVSSTFPVTFRTFSRVNLIYDPLGHLAGRLPVSA